MNQGNNLEHDFSAVILVLIFPVRHLCQRTITEVFAIIYLWISQISPPHLVNECYQRWQIVGSLGVWYISCLSLSELLYLCSFYLCQYQSSDWLSRSPLKWSNLCRVNGYSYSTLLKFGMRVRLVAACRTREWAQTEWQIVAAHEWNKLSLVVGGVIQSLYVCDCELRFRRKVWWSRGRTCTSTLFDCRRWLQTQNQTSLAKSLCVASTTSLHSILLRSVNPASLMLLLGAIHNYTSPLWLGMGQNLSPDQFSPSVHRQSTLRCPVSLCYFSPIQCCFILHSVRFLPSKANSQDLTS